MSRLKLIIQSQKDDEDEGSFSGPCFQVSAGTELKEHPASGEEYLLKVIEERRSIPLLVGCKYRCEDGNKNQTPNIEEIPVASAPDKLKPTIEWQNIQVADFSESRIYVSRMRTHPDAVVKPFKYENNSRGWRKFFRSNEPALSHVIGLKGSELDYGLKILLKLLTEVKHGDTIEPVIGQWLYTFLACLKLPLLADTHSLLRDIVRKCAEIRSNIDPENDDAVSSAAPLNLFICLVGRYFRQYDLAD